MMRSTFREHGLNKNQKPIVTRAAQSLKRRIRGLYGPRLDAFVINRFHELWYNNKQSWRKNTYLGHGVRQWPLDMWLYQEIIFRTKPDFIIQTGIANGGGLLYFANLLDAMDAAPDVYVVGVDIKASRMTIKEPYHPRIRVVIGSSVEQETIDRIKALLPEGKLGMVSLDSDHRRDHVLREMEMYSPFVAQGAYMVVEDTNINGHPVKPQYGPGPAEAVELFMQKNNSFVNDDLWKRNLISFHHGGWLRRVR